MLIAISLWMICQYRLAGSRPAFFRRLKHLVVLYIFRRAALVLSAIYLVPFSLEAQQRNLVYEVVHNGKPIGFMHFRQVAENASIQFKLESTVKTRIVFLLHLFVKEETVYQNGILVFSSVFRTLNGKEKADIKTKLEGDVYKVNNGRKVKVFKRAPIRYNLLSMYAEEPSRVSNAYADSFSQFVPIEKIAKNVYKVTLPDGNYNYYHYQNGVCTIVEVHHSLYALKFILIRK